MKITVNNTEYSVSEELAELKLSTYLRENLGLTGTKIGCDIGICGSCTVLVNNKPKRSCLLKLKDVVNKEVLTIEGLASSDGTLQILFSRHLLMPGLFNAVFALQEWY